MILNLLVFFLISCAVQPMQKQVDTNFSLVNGEEKFLMNSFRFKIIEINDSRCPIGVKCFTAGDVKVKAQIESQIYTFILKANRNIHMRKPS